MTATANHENRCFDRCNACLHVHAGSPSGYRCPRCSCPKPAEVTETVDA